MSNKTDLQRNMDDVEDIEKKIVALVLKTELQDKDIKMLQKIVYGVVSIILTAVMIAITSRLLK